MLEFLIFIAAPFVIVLGLFVLLSFISNEIDKNQDL